MTAFRLAVLISAVLMIAGGLTSALSDPQPAAQAHRRAAGARRGDRRRVRPGGPAPRPRARAGRAGAAHRSDGVPSVIVRPRWLRSASSAASSRPGASTSATTSARSASTSRGRTAASGDLLHRRPARDHRRLRPGRAARAALRHDRDPARRRARPRALHPLPPVRRAASTPSSPGCSAAVTAHGDLNRMTQFKEKSAQQRELVSAALFFYPVLQAADVLAYRADEVPVGDDQRQHIELMREIAGASTSASATMLVVPEAPYPRGRRADHGPPGPGRRRCRPPAAPSRAPCYVLDEADGGAQEGQQRRHRLRLRGRAAAPDKAGITNLIEILAVVRGVDARARSSASSRAPATATSSGGRRGRGRVPGPGPRALRRAARRRGRARGDPGRRRREGAGDRRRRRSPTSATRWASGRARS